MDPDAFPSLAVWTNNNTTPPSGLTPERLEITPLVDHTVRVPPVEYTWSVGSRQHLRHPRYGVYRPPLPISCFRSLDARSNGGAIQFDLMTAFPPGSPSQNPIFGFTMRRVSPSDSAQP